MISIAEYLFDELWWSWRMHILHLLVKVCLSFIRISKVIRPFAIEVFQIQRPQEELDNNLTNQLKYIRNHQRSQQSRYQYIEPISFLFLDQARIKRPGPKHELLHILQYQYENIEHNSQSKYFPKPLLLYDNILLHFKYQIECLLRWSIILNIQFNLLFQVFIVIIKSGQKQHGRYICRFEMNVWYTDDNLVEQ